MSGARGHGAGLGGRRGGPREGGNARSVGRRRGFGRAAAGGIVGGVADEEVDGKVRAGPAARALVSGFDGDGCCCGFVHDSVCSTLEGA